MIYVFRYLAIAAYTVFWGTIGVFLFPFDRGGEAIAKMESRAAIGKLVVRVAD